MSESPQSFSLDEITAAFDGDDRTTAMVTIPVEPPFGLRLNVSQLENLMVLLSKLREQMTPPPPTEFKSKRSYEGIADPNWHVGAEAMDGNPLLHIRDPRLGWVTYVFSRSAAKELAERLRIQAEIPPPQLSQTPT